MLSKRGRLQQIQPNSRGLGCSISSRGLVLEDRNLGLGDRDPSGPFFFFFNFSLGFAVELTDDVEQMDEEREQTESRWPSVDSRRGVTYIGIFREPSLP